MSGVHLMRAVSWVIPLSHAFGAVFDNPDLITACVIGDGEAGDGAAGDGVAFE